MNASITSPRHERAPVAPDPLPATDRRALRAIATGLALTVAAMVALVVDLTSTGVLADHLHQVYDGHVTPPAEGAVAAYLFTVGGLGVAGWLATAWAVRGRKRWAGPAATALFLVGVTVAVAHLSVAEYGTTVLPGEVGVAGLLPCIAGLVAVVQLWAGRWR